LQHAASNHSAGAAGAADFMTFIRQLGANSAIYAFTNVLQKAAAFLLMPLYTTYLDPDAYGVLAIVTAVNGFLGIAFTIGLTGAITRFYFEYQENPQMLAQFWGTVLSFVLLLSAVLGSVLLLVGDRLLRPIIGNVAFWPYVALGILATFFQPFFTTFLAVLQTRNQAARYAVISLLHFLLTTGLTIALVVVLKLGVTGALGATLAAAVVFFTVALYYMRADISFGLRWRHLREALVYSLPQVPHSLASQTIAMADRLILNSRIGTAAAGIYSVGAMISMAVEVVANSVNRAYVPLSMRALKDRNPWELTQMRATGSLVVAGFCLFGAAIATFAPQIVRLLTTAEFAPAARVVPILVFSGVCTAIYYLLVNVLFFERAAIKLLPACTLTGAALNVSLALALTPRFGLIGAAAANLLGQVALTMLVGTVGRRFDPVAWDYGRYALAFASGLVCAWWLSALDATILVVALFKPLGLLILVMILGIILWRRPLILLEALVRILRRRPADAIALFMSPKAAT
jgi:O-antigen/teichoic acid export membrane protein